MSDERNEPATTRGGNVTPALKPDPETLHTTDPEKHMEGPVSSLMQNISDGFGGDETKEEADRKKDKNM